VQFAGSSHPPTDAADSVIIDVMAQRPRRLRTPLQGTAERGPAILRVISAHYHGKRRAPRADANGSASFSQAQAHSRSWRLGALSIRAPAVHFQPLPHWLTAALDSTAGASETPEGFAGRFASCSIGCRFTLAVLDH
jgi:hypothetical protein